MFKLFAGEAETLLKHLLGSFHDEQIDQSGEMAVLPPCGQETAQQKEQKDVLDVYGDQKKTRNV